MLPQTQGIASIRPAYQRAVLIHLTLTFDSQLTHRLNASTSHRLNEPHPQPQTLTHTL